MPGVGPPPKDPSQRRRRNAPQRGEWEDIAAPAKPVVPPLSRIGKAPEGGWPARTRALWDEIRKDPATTVWGPSEQAAAVELAYLHAEWCVYGPASMAGEIRLRSDGLGLTLKGKRDLRLRVVDRVPDAAPAPRGRTRRSSGAAAGTAATRHEHLRVVL